MPQTNRRAFIHQTGLGIAGATIAASAPSRVVGASERLRIALIGCGGRGTYDAGLFAARADCEIAWIADCHQQRLAEAAKQFDTATPTDDLRRVLDDPSVDAVINATPVHWHAPGTILACEAGKHVYVEKPCSHNVREGRLMVEAARRNDCVVQHGTQVRSTSTIKAGIQVLREGFIGDVLVAKAWNIQRRAGSGTGTETDPPAELNYDQWLGPAPDTPYRDTFFSGWNWRREFGTGEIGNDGIHDIDYARWGLGVDTHPSRITAAGGQYLNASTVDFPDTQQVCFEYPQDSGPTRMLIYEQRLWSTNYPHNCDSGVEYYGTQGQMFLTRRGKIEVLLDRNEQLGVDAPLEPQNTEAHVADFIDAIRNGRKSNADPETAHLTTSLCHLGNIATRLSRVLNFDPQQEHFADDEEANSLLARSYRDHWAKPQHGESRSRGTGM